MNFIKRTFIISVMALFAVNSVAAAALAACHCPDASHQMEMSDGDMPCHDMAESDESANQDDIDQAQCLDCGCGHCKVPSPASILGVISDADILTSEQQKMTHNDVRMPTIVFGIDYPPKQNS